MKYYLIAGEASGDLHGSYLITALKHKDPDAEIRCWGGDMMQESGGVLAKHYRDLAFMGFVEVVQHLGTIMKNIRFCKDDISAFRPDVVVFIDYPGFNLRIAEWAKKTGYKTAYYISPTIWAWKENRVQTIKKYVDRMMVILPFEKSFYKKHGYEADYVGHPLVEEIDRILTQPSSLHKKRKTIALLPGSRTQEINKILPTMLNMIPHFPDYDFIIAKAPAQSESVYTQWIGNYEVQLVGHKTYDILKIADAAIVASGTATLETALLGVPEVVVYKSNMLTYMIAKRLAKVKYISLVNLILDKPAVTELIQTAYNTEALEKELRDILENKDKQDAMQMNYTKLWKKLSEEGRASDKAAAIIFSLVNKPN